MRIIAALTIALATALPVSATPQREVIAYDEMMVKIDGLEHLGYSRISTVDACVEETGVVDYTNLMTDSELEGFEACLTSYN